MLIFANGGNGRIAEMKIVLLVLLNLVLSIGCYAQWIKQSVDTAASFRGLSVVSERVVWASGTGGTVIRTINGGKKWDVIQVPDAAKLDFRDIEAFDANTAYILSIGNGESSRIYKTTDGGATWKLQFKNTNEKAFFDAIACWDKKNCIAMSDPVDNKFVLINTKDDGANWTAMDSSKMPATKTGEAAFAASGTCLITQGKNKVFLVSGGMDARVFRLNDRGKTWLVADTPMVKGTPGSGIFSIAMFDQSSGVIVGGNYEKRDEAKDNLAFTTDGKVWSIATGLSGYRSGVAYVDRKTIIAVGTNGTDVSLDSGKTWKVISELDLNSVASTGKTNTWAVGPLGLVVKMSKVAASSNRPKGLPLRNEFPVVANVTDLRLNKNGIEANCPVLDTNCIESKIVNVATSTIDLERIRYVYRVTGGRIVGEGANVRWDLSTAKPGKYLITAAISQPVFGKWQVIGRTETREVIVR